MSKPPGRPKSADPKRALTIRVRASALDGFADTNAARSAIEALVEARYGPGLSSVLAKAFASAPVGDARATPGPALRAAVRGEPMRKPRAPVGSLMKKPKGKS